MKQSNITPQKTIEQSIHWLRGQKVMLDSFLAGLYGVSTKQLVQAVKRNLDRFPEDFMFQLEPQEHELLRSQIVTSNVGRGGRRYAPYAFTEQGVAMLSRVLRSRRAIRVNVEIMRAFVKMRAALTDTRDLARKLAAVDAELKSRLDVHEVAIVEVLQRLMKILDPPLHPQSRPLRKSDSISKRTPRPIASGERPAVADTTGQHFIKFGVSNLAHALSRSARNCGWPK